MVGGRYQVKPSNCATPAIVVREILPVAPLPTVTFTKLSETVPILAATPPIVTLVTVPRYDPIIDITVPAPPIFGDTEFITGGGTKVKPLIEPDPAVPETVTLPLAPV